MTPRDRRYGKVIGARPYSGRRYVRDGKVRIEWFAHGKRRTQTIGPNTAANRALADHILEEALAEVRTRTHGRRQYAALTVGALLVKRALPQASPFGGPRRTGGRQTRRRCQFPQPPAVGAVAGLMRWRSLKKRRSCPQDPVA